MKNLLLAAICAAAFLMVSPKVEAHGPRGGRALFVGQHVNFVGGHGVFLGVHNRDFVRVRVGFNELFLPTNRLLLDPGYFVPQFQANYFSAGFSGYAAPVDPCTAPIPAQLPFPAFSSTTIVEGRRRVFVFGR